MQERTAKQKGRQNRHGDRTRRPSRPGPPPPTKAFETSVRPTVVSFLRGIGRHVLPGVSAPPRRSVIHPHSGRQRNDLSFRRFKGPPNRCEVCRRCRGARSAIRPRTCASNCDRAPGSSQRSVSHRRSIECIIRLTLTLLFQPRVSLPTFSQSRCQAVCIGSLTVGRQGFPRESRPISPFLLIALEKKNVRSPPC